MEVWRVHGEMLLSNVAEERAQTAVAELRDGFAAQGWGSANYGAGIIVFDFYPPDVYTAEDAHRTAVGLIDNRLEELGIDSWQRRWTRVEPIAEEQDQTRKR
jgi:hypothetical protein